MILVTDIDLMYSDFFMVRAMGQDPDQEVSFNFDNVTFVLNVLDALADDQRFIDIRKRRPKHRILERDRGPHGRGPREERGRQE